MQRNIWPHTSMRLRSGLSLASKAAIRRARPDRRSILRCRTCCGGESARPRCDSDDAVFAIRERGGGRARIAARRPFLCPAADWLPGSDPSAVSLSLISSTKIGGTSLREICDDQSTRYQSEGLSRDLSLRTMTAYRRDPSKVNRDTSERKIPPWFIHRKNDDNATTGRWPSHHHNQRKYLTISVRQQRQINSLGNLPKFYAILRGVAGWRDFDPC
jgi:hypothetical protein